MPYRVLVSTRVLFLLIGSWQGPKLEQGTPCGFDRPRPAPRALFGEAHRMVPLKLDNTFGAALGDVDGDGDLDVYSGDNSGDGLLVNDGTGRLTAETLPPSVREFGTWDVSLRDLDGDGDLDALLGREETDKVLRNVGCARFEELVNAFPREFDRAGKVLVEDFDGDADLDALVANQFALDRFYLNGGSGVFASTSSRIPAASSFIGVAGDFDGDGDADAVLGGEPALLRNDGSAHFTLSPGAVPAHPYFTAAIAAGDVDEDGDLDLYLGNQGGFTSRDSLFVNDGLGVFSDATHQVEDVGDATLSVALGDVDGDGDLDAFSGYVEDHLLENDGSGTFANRPGNLPDAPLAFTNAPAFGDLDGDLDLDLYLGRGIFDGTEKRLYLNDGSGRFEDVTHLEPMAVVADRSEEAAWADLDADGDLDGIVANGRNFIGGEPPSRHRLLRNDGTGAFEDDGADLSSSLALAHSLALGDLDGDEDVDVVFGNSDFSGVQNDLRLNDGLGVFGPGPALPPALDQTEATVLSDLDRDGDLDLVFGNSDSRANRLLLNDGLASFTEASSRLPVRNDLTEALAAGDVDADGDEDLVLGNRFAPKRLFLNDGSGSFTDGTSQLPSLSEETRAVLLGDLDGDGDADLYVANFFEQDELYWNDGSGHFAPATPGALPADSDPERSIALGDVDDDGDPDLVFAVNYIAGRNRLYANDGHGRFTPESDWLPDRTTKTYHVSLPDVDGDGDLDLYYANGESESTDDRGFEDLLFLNSTRHLAWQAPPRIGQPLRMELAGPAREPWILLAADGRSRVPTPYGILLLDPSTIRAVGHGRTGPNGVAVWETSIPGDVALIGETTWWQAGVGHEKRFTNLEATTLTGL